MFLRSQPFTKTLDDFEGLIKSIWAIFFADIVTSNAIQLLDPVGHLQRHFLAPRAATQDLMNLNMQGQVVELAERYTVSPAWKYHMLHDLKCRRLIELSVTAD